MEQWRNLSFKPEKNFGLKDFVIKYKIIISLQYSWIRRLYDDSFHDWKIITLHLLKMSFGSAFKSF